MYALQVEQLERWVSAERQVAASLMVAGADGVVLPTMSEVRKSFDDDLDVPFHLETVDPERNELLKALGLRHAG